MCSRSPHRIGKGIDTLRLITVYPGHHPSRKHGCEEEKNDTGQSGAARSKRLMGETAYYRQLSGKVVAGLYDLLTFRSRAHTNRHFFTSTRPSARASMPLHSNVLMASFGVSTIGSPRKLNDVLRITGTPERRSNVWISR